MIDILANLIPICPGCHCVMLRRDWNTPRPKADCHNCGKTHYYSGDGKIVMSAKIRRAA